MGLTGLGAAVRFIPRMVVIGFTNGIAVLIASTQIRDFFGLRIPSVPSEFLPRMHLLAIHFATLNPYALGLGLGTLAILVILPRLLRRIPASIVAVLVCTGVSVAFHLPVETIGTRFGGIPRGLPLRNSQLSFRAHPAADPGCIHRRHARCVGKYALGGRC